MCVKWNGIELLYRKGEVNSSREKVKESISSKAQNLTGDCCLIWYHGWTDLSLSDSDSDSEQPFRTQTVPFCHSAMSYA